MQNLSPQQQQMLLNQQMLLMGMGGMNLGQNQQNNIQQSGETKLDA
jgi:hypothetical protein